MNRVYKVIYNRARNLYQVVSEITHSRGKARTVTARQRHERLTTSILIALLAMGTSLPVGWADDTAGTTTPATDPTTVEDAKVDASNLSNENKAAWRTALGGGKVAAGDAKLIAGQDIYKELRPIAATSETLTYVSPDKSTADNLKKLDIQLGTNTTAISTLNTTIGTITSGTTVAGNLSNLDTQVKNNAAGLSALSNTVSTNNTNLNTKITSITSAITSLKELSNITDAGKKVITGLSTKITQGDRVTITSTSDATTGQTTYTISANNDGTIISGDTNLVSGGTMYKELRPTSGKGKYISAGQSTAENLISLDQNLLNVVNALGLDADDTSKSYTSKLNKYFKVNPEVTTADTTTTYKPDAAANGTNSVAIGPSAQAGEKTTDATTSATTVTGGTSSTAIGDSAKANGDQSVALGYNSQVLNASGSTIAVSGSTAIGNGAKVDTASNAMALGTSATINKTATSGVAIGNGAVTGSADTTKTVDNVTYNVKAAGGVDSVAIGTSTSNAGNTSVALGKGATIENDTDGNYQAVVKSDDIAIGTEAKTSASDSSTAIGKGAKVSQSTDALAFGSGAQVSTSNNAMAFGKGANAGSAADSIAMGTSATTISADTIAIGQSTSAEGANSVVIGKKAKTTTEGGNAIGSGSAASGNSTAIGQSATANNYNAVAIGNNATANADKSISLGYNAGVGTSEGKGETQNAGSLIAIGTSSGNKVSGMQNVAIGEEAGSNVKSSYNIAIGTQAGYGINYASDDKTQNGFNVSVGYRANYQANSANIMYSTALGNEANASNYSVAVGNRAKAGGVHTVAIGEDAQATDASSIALGQNASAADGNIAIGNGSSAPAVSTLGTVKAVTVDGTTVNYVYDANGNQFKSAFTYKPLQADSHYISVGSSTLTRRISNVADGVFDSDAATVGQLNSLNELLQATDTKVGLNKEYFEEKFTNLNTTIDASKTHYFSISESSDNLSANKDNKGAISNKADAMAIGPNANATNVKSLAVGNNVYANGLRSIAIGTAPNPTKDSAGTTTTHNTSADGENSIALGTSTTAQAANSIAIGTRAQTYTTDTTSNTGVSSVAIGNMATTAGNQSVALGYNATVKYNYGTAIGAEALASGVDAVAIGKGSKAYSTDSTAVGQDNSITGNNVYGLGSSNEMNGKWGAITQSGVSGYKNIITSVSDQDTTNALTGIYMTGNSNTLNQNVEYNVMQDITVQGNSNTIDGGAGGTSSHQNTLSQIAIVGSGNTVQGKSKSSDDGKTNNIKDVTILGYNNTVDANNDTTVDFSNTQILGNNVTAALGNSVYLGNNAAYVQPNGPAQDAIDAARTKADTAAEASDEYKAAATDEDKATIKAQYEAKYLYKLRVQAMEAKGTTAGMNSYNTDETYGNGTNYTYAGSNPAGVIIVGSVGAERRIQNVAAGLVSATSTDAVNGSQLYALTRQIRFGGDNSSFGKTTAAEDQNVVARGSNETISITGGSDAVKSSTADGTTTYTVDAAKLTGNNIAVVADKDANALHVQLASNLKDLNTAQLGSGSGDSYKETIKLDGTDTTNGGTLELKDATGANGVTLRTSGTTTTADVNGTATTRLLVNDKTVATTDDGLKFGGDTGNDSALKLNNKLNVKGGTTDTSKLTDSNIGVVSDGSGTLTVKLNKNVNLGTDGSLTTGAVTATAVTADTVASGNSTLNTNGLTITNGPSVLATGINAGSKKITNVSDGEANADAANYGQVKAAKTILTQGNNTQLSSTTADDGHQIYTVNVDNLSYKAGTDTTARSVTLSNGLTFQNGKNTTAVAGDNGTITYNLNDKIELGSETDSNNHIVVDGTKGLLTLGMDATINGNAGTASIGGVSIGKSGSDQVITGLTNKTWTVGTTQAVDGRAATENQLQSVAENLNTANTNIATLQHGFKVQANGDTTTESTVKADDALNFTAGDNAKVTTTKDSKQITISVDNLSVKDNNGTAQNVKLADGLNFQDGTNTNATVGTNGSVTYDLKSSITLGTATDEANRIIVNGTNGTITVGNLATINGNAGTASIGGVSIGKSGSDQTVTGLSNTTWVVGTTKAVSGRAATENQLQSVSDAAHTNANNITTLQQGFTVTANGKTDTKSTVKAGETLNFQAGKNVQISTTADSKSIEVALSDTPEFTTVTAKDANGNITTVSGTGVTITPTGTGTQSVSLTSEGLDNGNHVIKNVASGGDTDTNAANISDVKRLVEASANGTTETGFNVKGDDATAKKVKLGKQLNVVGGTNDTNNLSDGNIGVITTDDGQGNAILTVKLNKNIALDSVTTGSTTLNTSGVSNGDMSLTNTGLVIKNNDASKQVSVTTSGVSMGSQRIQNVADATQDTDAATLGQVKNARTVVAQGDNVKGVTSSEATDGSHQMTYTVNVDNLSVKANKEAAKSVTLKNGLTFNNGTNTTASVGDNGEVKYDLNSTLTGLTSVTAGNSTLDTHGLTIKEGTAPKVVITSSNVTMGGNVIHNVGAGQVGTDAVNKDQLDALQNQVNGGWNLAGKNSDRTAVTAKIGAGKTVTYDNGNYTKAVVTKDDSNNATVNVDVTTGTFGSGTGDKAGTVTATANGLATTQDVANAINSAYWTIQDGNNPGNAQQVKAGAGDNTVSLKAGDNLSLDQNGKGFTYKLNKTLTGMTSVTAVDDKKNTAVLNSEGLKVSDEDGNSLTQHATEIRLHDATKAATVTTTDVVLNKQGLQNGGHTITGVANGTVDANSQDAINGSQLYELQQKVTNGWKITGDDTTKASNIGNDKTVSFVNGDNSYIKAKVDTTNTGATVSYTAQTASLTTTDGKAALTGTTDGLVTGMNLTSVLNSLSWTAQSSQVGSGQNNGSTLQSITAGSKVGFIAGNNMILTQDGTNFTYALNSSLTGMNTIAFTGLGNGASNLTIGLQNGGGANPDKGYYITGLSNTKWDQSNYEGTRAATEAQLREAIDKVSAATGTGGFGLTADDGANNGGETKVTQTLGRTIAIQGDGTYGADGTVVKQGNISTVAYTDNAGPTGAIKVKLNNDIDLSEAGSLTIGASKVSAGSIVLDNTGDAAKKIALNSTAGTASIGDVTVNGAAKTVMGLANTTWDGTAVSGRAATEDQLAKAISDASTQASNSELHIRKGTYGVGKDKDGQDLADPKGKNSVSIDVVNAKGAVDGQVVINDVAKASELGTVGELADNLKNPNGGPTTVVQAVNKVNQKVDDSLKQVNGDVTNAVTEAKKHTEMQSVDSDNNVTIDGKTTNADGGTVYKLGLNKQHMNLDKVHIYGTEGKVTAKDVEAETVKTGNTTVADGRVVVGGDNGIKIEANGDQQTISGLSNKTWNGRAVSGRAATEDQLQQAVENATATAAQNEQHIQAGNYNVGQGKGLDGKAIDKNSVAINVVSGDGTKPGDVKGQVVINNVAKADELGDVAKLNDTVKNADGRPTSTVDAINNLDKRVETKVGDNVYSGVKGKEIADGDSATTAIGKLNNRMNDIYTTAGQHSSVSTADTNLTLSESKNASGGTDYKIGLNKDQINLGNLTIKGNEGSIETKSIKSDSFTAGDTVVNKDGIKVGNQSALTGDSLKVNGKTYVDDKGVDANGQVIRNVGDGKDDGDAVNVKQVNDLAARQGEVIGQNAAHINQLDRAVNRLDSRINRVGAGAAALAALHPGNYDPDDKVDFAAGFGNYRGASAAAVGMYYHPDETTTMSVGASFGGGENMVNAGITWKMGKDSGHMRTQAATKAVPVQFVAAPTQTTQSTGQTEGTKTPQPVTAVTTTASGQQVPIVAAYLPSVDNSTRAENDELKELLARQTAILEKLAEQKTAAAPAAAAAPVSGEDLFPDVPENHWAYDFVAKLAQAGALKDCRVEDPANNPMLTRNDFAQILYTALKNGATKNPALNKDNGLNRLASEFRVELKNVKR